MRLAGMFLALLAIVPLGCGKSASSLSTVALASKPGANGGTAFPLADGKGYAEVVVETVKQTKKGRDVVLAVYFVKEDLKTALSPVPTGTSIKIIVPGEQEERRANLAAAPKKPDDGRFATEVGQFDFDEMHGEVIATIDGKPATVTFAIR